MDSNGKQKILSGFDRLARESKLRDIVHNLTDRSGLATLAQEIGVDKAALSRFRSGDGALTLEAVERLLQAADSIVIERQRYIQIMSTILTLAQFLQESIDA